ncbi:hypothetical protein GCM10017655_42860 [Pseudomonas turukhanskensis]|uniref:Uncharacterized protein n=1 Tax=Pseudomonas turukhanskensis TaxID=1806536 RepID=A0A9W6K962_9PSED|nr:hypothetical protein GCM10017655_42860 [Pseudomonas turukhanskensis]
MLGFALLNPTDPLPARAKSDPHPNPLPHAGEGADGVCPTSVVESAVPHAGEESDGVGPASVVDSPLPHAGKEPYGVGPAIVVGSPLPLAGEGLGVRVSRYTV